MTPPRSGFVAATAALLIGTSIACGGGGGGGGGGPTTPPGVNFTPTGGATANSCFLQEGGGTNANRLVLEVRVNSVTDWYGVAFDLDFPANLLDFTKATEGSFPGGETALEVTEVGGGRLIVGHTRLGNTPGRDGSGLLMTLEFSTTGINGSGPISFDNEQAFRENSFPQNVTFIAGTLSVAP